MDENLAFSEGGGREKVLSHIAGTKNCFLKAQQNLEEKKIGNLKVYKIYF